MQSILFHCSTKAIFVMKSDPKYEGEEPDVQLRFQQDVSEQ